MMRLAILAGLALFAFDVSGAEVFRCVTENGVVRYSDMPCTDGKTERLDITSRPTDPDAVTARNRARTEQVDALEQADAAAREATADAEKKKEERAAACASARERLEKMLMERRMYRENDGEREYLTSDEMVQRRQDAGDKVNELCGT